MPGAQTTRDPSGGTRAGPGSPEAATTTRESCAPRCPCGPVMPGEEETLRGATTPPPSRGAGQGARARDQQSLAGQLCPTDEYFQGAQAPADFHRAAMPPRGVMPGGSDSSRLPQGSDATQPSNARAGRRVSTAVMPGRTQGLHSSDARAGSPQQ
ncbi:hypothetical protein NDU88_001117 [Pleurodeles waltl]|uniref:Uncharacterized protein n=1 Tax=Pleurodeles waltl TaxID=8319 RepID=A0AAV7RC21_PLEWA|nr:hypothetical protein NDU88_001117 [Pleurodeles waltl]